MGLYGCRELISRNECTLGATQAFLFYHCQVFLTEHHGTFGTDPTAVFTVVPLMPQNVMS